MCGVALFYFAVSLFRGLEKPNLFFRFYFFLLLCEFYIVTYPFVNSQCFHTTLFKL